MGTRWSPSGVCSSFLPSLPTVGVEAGGILGGLWSCASCSQKQERLVPDASADPSLSSTCTMQKNEVMQIGGLDPDFLVVVPQSSLQ